MENAQKELKFLRELGFTSKAIACLINVELKQMNIDRRVSDTSVRQWTTWKEGGKKIKPVIIYDAIAKASEKFK